MTNIERVTKYHKDQRVRQTPNRQPFAEKVVRDGTVTEDCDQFGWPLVRFDDHPVVVAANPIYLETITEVEIPDEAITRALAWLQEIIDDRPEGAYDGQYDVYQAAHARTLLNVHRVARISALREALRRHETSIDGVMVVRGSDIERMISELEAGLNG
jgi:hypothetical protein